MKKSLLLILAAVAFAAAPTYKVVLPGSKSAAPRWDYPYLDSANQRLYIAHGGQTDVVDTTTDKVIGTIPGTNGVHGIAVAGGLGRGFTTDGGDNDVTVFDLSTSPSGLAIDPKGPLYSVCGGQGACHTADRSGTDGVAVDDFYAFSANGGDGTITMVGETSPGKF
jgi:hypothetical protein